MLINNNEVTINKSQNQGNTKFHSIDTKDARDNKFITDTKNNVFVELDKDFTEKEALLHKNGNTNGNGELKNIDEDTIEPSQKDGNINDLRFNQENDNNHFPKNDAMDNHNSQNEKSDNSRHIPVIDRKNELLNSHNTAQVLFQGNRREFYFIPANVNVNEGDEVIAETENGVDLGKITGKGELIFRKWNAFKLDNDVPVYSILHKVSPKEKQRHQANLEDQEKILEKVKSLILKHKLEMRATEIEWQFDRRRLTIYFLAPQRIDFRDLVKELAKEYRTRIELRQITHRERARRITLWEGICGRSICCSSFMNQVKPITIEHSRAQQLSANVAKLSGYCGRLKCCLAFEYDFYLAENERFPRLGTILQLEDKSFRLIKFDIFKDILTFYCDEQHHIKNFSLNEVNTYAKDNLLLEPREASCNGCGGHEESELEELMNLQD
ncbi:MAG: hypothetical protein A2X64_00925 [Ignavibacteria bacterium GWF2_33_9]|nr:MAG: hypothetical protein A2X64_00925 [Ignavibacteria bacterium GWF2_33_9]